MGDLRDRSAVILDQHPLWLEALQQLLDRIGVEVVGKTSRAQEALALVREREPDIFVTELEFSDGEYDGLSCLREACETNPSIKAIVLSAYEGAHQIDSAFEAGASVYCAKRACPDDLASAIRQAFEQSVFYARGRTMASSVDERREEAAGLTRREREILALVAEGHPNSQLAKMLWVTEQTIKFHLSNIYRKLGVSNRTEASRWAQLHGLLPASTEDVVAA